MNDAERIKQIKQLIMQMDEPFQIVEKELVFIIDKEVIKDMMIYAHESYVSEKDSERFDKIIKSTLDIRSLIKFNWEGIK